MDEEEQDQPAATIKQVRRGSCTAYKCKSNCKGFEDLVPGPEHLAMLQGHGGFKWNYCACLHTDGVHKLIDQTG